MGNDPSLDELKDTLVRKTQGNPYYIEECIAALVESGKLTDMPDGSHQLRQPVGEFVIPGSLRGALAARIDQLESADRDVLLHAAAIGRTFDTSLLEVIIKLPMSAVAAHVLGFCRPACVAFCVSERWPRWGCPVCSLVCLQSLELGLCP